VTNARRVKQIQMRARVRRWEFRQRHLAHGAWQRFRLALAMADEAYAVDEATMQSLVGAGCVSDDRGRALEPPRQIVWITPEQVVELGGARRLALRLDADMLATIRLALVAFAGIDPGVRP